MLKEISVCREQGYKAVLNAFKHHQQCIRSRCDHKDQRMNSGSPVKFMVSERSLFIHQEMYRNFMIQGKSTLFEHILLLWTRVSEVPHVLINPNFNHFILLLIRYNVNHLQIKNQFYVYF